MLVSRRRHAPQRSAVDFQLSLQSETIRSVYPEDPVAVEPDTPIEDVLRLMQAERATAVLVCEGDQLAGLFTERDSLRLAAEKADLQRPISEVMSQQLVTVTENDTVGEVIHRMADGGYRHLPIVSAIHSGEATGMIDVRGVMRYLVEHFPSTIYNLPPTRPTGGERSAAQREGA